MRRALIFVGVLVFAFAFFGGIERLLVVRQAMQAGVFARTTCVSERERQHQASHPLSPARRDHHLARVIQFYERGNAPGHDRFWRVRVMGNQIVLKLSYSNAARQSMLEEFQRNQKICRFSVSFPVPATVA